VKLHPYHTLEILRRVGGFGDIAEIAAAHHEKLDGSGYFRSMTAETLSVPARILVVADIYDALAADRPYRSGLDPDTVIGILRKGAPHALDANCVEALAMNVSSTAIQLARLNDALGQSVKTVVPVAAA
jgi:HD-GYP domain-containing protein (c-di-GMP phosphodiesterase class II)